MRAAQLTTEARAELAAAEEVLYLVGDPLSERALLELAPRARSLAGCYEEERPYESMTEAILEPLRAGKRVCAAFYGHPGMFVLPSREAITRARADGFPARMLPGISALDCLFADLGVDPAAAGCQTYEASDFARRGPVVEPRSVLVLWQAGVAESRDALVAALRRSYPAAHELVVYEASPYPTVAALAELVRLDALQEAQLTPRATLYVPPLDAA
jgi:precorrin-6B methylase 1